jgi:uncharacterized membrane protein YagU involved in acid resistance
MMRHRSILGTLARGTAAGLAAGFIQNLFFKTTAKIAPTGPERAFEPPEAIQREETPTATVARRIVEGVMQRELSDVAKQRASTLVHYGYSAFWGRLYALLRERNPRVASPAGSLAYGTAVWALSDNLILPLFKLADWPQAYPLRNHAYTLTSHLVWSSALTGFYELFRWGPVAAPLALMAVRTWFERRPSKRRFMRARRRPLLRTVRESVAAAMQ